MSQFDFKFDDDNDNFNDSTFEWSGRNATIFLIDACSEMFNRKDKESPIYKALRCVHSSISRKVVGNDQDLYSVILFDTDKSKNPLEFGNIFILQELCRPGAERMIEIESILEDTSSLTAKYGSSSALIHEALWVCRSVFSGSKLRISGKNILLFTCVDDPHGGDDHKLKQAVKGAKDVKDAGIELEILPLSSSFNSSKFYMEVLTLGGFDEASESISILANPSQRLDELMDRVLRFEHKQRSIGKITFTLAPGVEMAVKVFGTIRRIYKTRTKLFKVTNEEVFSQRKEFLEDGELIMPSDLVKYHEVKGKKIKFTMLLENIGEQYLADEVKSISRLYDTGIELLGFKPISAMKHYHYVKPGQFIYADENSIKGSLSTFSCLLERCAAREMCPIVRVTAREGSALSWAFLLPQEEVKDDSGCQVKAPGFYICYLPFADDFRLIELHNFPRAQTKQVDAAKEMIKKLHFKFDPDCFDNPDIQTHWRNVETLALNRHYLEPVTDYTVPDYDKMEKKAGHLIRTFKSLVLSPGYDADAMMKKRTIAAPSTSAPKKPKFDPSSCSVEDMARLKKADKLTVDVMRQWLQEKGVRVTGKKKAQMVQDIYDFMQIDV